MREFLLYHDSSMIQLGSPGAWRRPTARAGRSTRTTTGAASNGMTRYIYVCLVIINVFSAAASFELFVS